MRVRKTVSAVMIMAGALVLSGCSGFLVPAGEGEPGPTPSPAATGSAQAGAGGVRAEPLPTPSVTADVPAQGAPSPSESTADCPASGVRVDVGPVLTAMFNRAVTLTLVNCGTKPYRVNGYPSVRALGEDGKRIPVPVNADGSMFGNDQGAKGVTLKPGGTVRSILAWVSTEEGGDLIEGNALEIAPAPDTGARIFPLEGHDLRLMDELNTTAWRTELPE
ncbi:DUF4232 domain-containing protein [Streptomyces sp. NPDC059499]|uniref:DUF4232 domain-containing protein n=1 Tax=Streptomyces sp. NPDC059499 TaxID=3346852 RepID=UPI00369155BB